MESEEPGGTRETSLSAYLVLGDPGHGSFIVGGRARALPWNVNRPAKRVRLTWGEARAVVALRRLQRRVAQLEDRLKGDTGSPWI